MTIKEAKNFYAQDKKEYKILNNKEFLKWLNDFYKNGYYPFIDILELQKFINTIKNWYEMKYPEREMEYYDGIQYCGMENVTPLSKTMDIKQLLYRLSNNQLFLLEGEYRSNAGGNRDVRNENGEIIGHKPFIMIRIDKKNINDDINNRAPFYFYIDANLDGKVNYIDFSEKFDDKIDLSNTTLDQLLKIFKEKYSEKYDFYKLEECVYNHKCDLELRNKILQLVALSILYSKDTTPKRGYERAKRYINEFNKKLNLNISSEEIDEIMSRDYNYDKEITHTDTKKENKPFEKAKQLIKSIF